MSKPTLRHDYKVFYPIITRWMDNDIYGHINNVTYYSYFDSAVNRYLIEEANLDIQQASIIAYVVSSNCQYCRPIAYPEKISVGIRVKKLGNSSVRYGVSIFKEDESEAAAFGEFTHVFVNRTTNQSTEIPLHIRNSLKLLQD
jgi:acyl-CoA thioester hydrolase